MTGKLVQPTLKGKAGAVELPEYHADSKQITYDGKRIDAPDGLKFITDDGQTFILHHEKHVPGGWKRMRTVSKKNDKKDTTKK